MARAFEQTVTSESLFVSCLLRLLNHQTSDASSFAQFAQFLEHTDLTGRLMRIGLGRRLTGLKQSDRPKGGQWHSLSSKLRPHIHKRRVGLGTRVITIY